MDSVSRTQLQFDPLGSNRRLRVTPVVRNRATPVAVIRARLPSQPLPGFVSPAVGVVQDPAVGIPAYGQGQPLPVSGPPQPGQTTGIPAYATGIHSLFVSGGPSHPGYFPAGIPVAQHPAYGGAGQPFSISSQQPPQRVVVGPTQPQQFAGYIPTAAGIPVTQNSAYGGGGQPFPIPGQQPPQGVVVEPPKPQQFVGSVPTAQGVPVTQHQVNGGGGQSASGCLDNCLLAIRCGLTMEECYRLNGDGCCTGVCGDQGCFADVCGFFSGLFSFLG